MSGSERLTGGVRSADRRIAKTRSALIKAMIDRIRNEAFDHLTVSEIADDANVGRTTFYEHYGGKRDLLDAVVVELLVAFTESTGFRISDFVDHVLEEPDLSCAMFAVDGFRQGCVDALAEALDGQDPLARRFAAHGLLGVLEDWTRSSDDHPERRSQLDRHVSAVLAVPPNARRPGVRCGSHD